MKGLYKHIEDNFRLKQHRLKERDRFISKVNKALVMLLLKRGFKVGDIGYLICMESKIVSWHIYGHKKQIKTSKEYQSVYNKMLAYKGQINTDVMVINKILGKFEMSEELKKYIGDYGINR